MRDFVREISDVLKSWKKYAHTRLADETIDKVMMHVEERLKNLNPVLSLYGAYNAGKSTLLNALLGAEVATTGDSPETFKIDEYNWGGWTIYDTPGVDAPIEHEELTEDHLRKSECILFVLSTDGDLEVRAIYERLAKLAQRGKPVLLVLNDKSGLLRDNDADRLSEV